MLVDSRRSGGARRTRRALPATTHHHPRERARQQDGAVAAEAAVAVPFLVALSLGLVWLVCLAVAQVRVVDAARETARAIARDEAQGAAVTLGRRVAPEGARIVVSGQGDAVQVTVSAVVAGPGGLFAFLPGVDVDAVAVTAREPS